MTSKLAVGKTVRRKASATPPPSENELAQIRTAAAGPIDTSDIPEKDGDFQPIERDPKGRLPGPIPQLRHSPIREAVLAELDRRQMTRYELWQAAVAHCPTLTSSAVYEFLKGQREIGLPYVEAILTVMKLTITREASPHVVTSRTPAISTRAAQQAAMSGRGHKYDAPRAKKTPNES